VLTAVKKRTPITQQVKFLSSVAMTSGFKARVRDVRALMFCDMT
jgi:hypothetical protein